MPCQQKASHVNIWQGDYKWNKQSFILSAAVKQMPPVLCMMSLCEQVEITQANSSLVAHKENKSTWFPFSDPVKQENKRSMQSSWRSEQFFAVLMFQAETSACRRQRE